MKILTLTRVMSSYDGLRYGDYHILNPYKVMEIGDVYLFDPKVNNWIIVTEVLFKDGHKVVVSEDATTVKDLWKDSL